MSDRHGDAFGPRAHEQSPQEAVSAVRVSPAIADLIKRLEAATGPDRAIEQAIFRTLDLTELQERHCREWCRMDGRTDLTRDRYLDAWAPSYTLSLDAALTLVPEGFGWKAFADNVEGTMESGASVNYVPVAAATPALALCIAALKARAHV